PLSWQEWNHLERVVERFENAWQRGESPALEDFLPDSAADRREMLVELVHADLEWRLKAGMSVRAEGYLDRFPELAGDRRLALELIAAEHELRGRHETELAIEESLRRFPQYADDLSARLQAPTRSLGDSSAAAGVARDADELPPPSPIDTVADLLRQIEE